MILRVGIFEKIIFCIANSQFIICYNNDKCFLVLVIYISLLCFMPFFFFKKRKVIDLKKPKSRNIYIYICIYFFLLKIRSVGPVDQQINLVSPKHLICCYFFQASHYTRIAFHLGTILCIKPFKHIWHFCYHEALKG